MKIIKTITASTTACALLICSTQLLAQRPAMNDRPALSTQQVPVDSHRPAPMAAPEPVVQEPAPVVEQTVIEEPMMEPEEVMEPAQMTEQMRTGDVLEIRQGEAVAVQLLDFPRRGMVMDKVKNELGDPSAIRPAIGEPPITAWVYSDRIVYFENTHVIHAVARN